MFCDGFSSFCDGFPLDDVVCACFSRPGLPRGRRRRHGDVSAGDTGESNCAFVPIRCNTLSFVFRYFALLYVE